MKKAVLYSLTFLMLFSCIACGRTKTPEESTTTSESTSTTTTTQPTETTKVDLGGYEFSILTKKNGFPWYSQPLNEEQQEYMDIWHTLEAEYRFKVSITQFEQMDTLDTYALSGVKAADVMYGSTDFFVAPLLGKYLKQLDTPEVREAGLDLSDGKIFEQNLINAVRIDDEAYFFNFCGEYFEAQIGHFAAFNKALCASAGYPAEVIYKAVRDHAWTWDVFLDVCRAGMVYDGASGEYSVYGTSIL